MWRSQKANRSCGKTELKDAHSKDKHVSKDEHVSHFLEKKKRLPSSYRSMNLCKENQKKIKNTQLNAEQKVYSTLRLVNEIRSSVCHDSAFFVSDLTRK